MRYVFLPMNGGYLSIAATVLVSTTLHGMTPYWLMWGCFNMCGFCTEKYLTRFEWYRKPGWVVVAVNQWVVVTCHAYPFESFTTKGIHTFAWTTGLFIGAMHMWAAIWSRVTSTK